MKKVVLLNVIIVLLVFTIMATPAIAQGPPSPPPKGPLADLWDTLDDAVTSLQAQIDGIIASPASGIETADITNWDTAFSWGDHSLAGYLTSYTETDPTVDASVKDGVDWSELSEIPAGFADGVDNEGGAGDGHSLDAADGAPVDAVYVDNDGEVGIGTTNPTERLTVAGGINILGPNGKINCLVRSLWGAYLNNGWISVHDATGQDQAGMYVNSAGNGIVWGDTKSFRVDNPNDPNTEIWYTSVEGPEAAAYIRGTAQLVDGYAVITFPDHFLAVAVEEGMTVQITPLSAESKGLAVTSKNLDGVVVQELLDGTGNYEFDWEVKCVRQGHEDYQVIHPKMDESHYSP